MVNFKNKLNHKFIYYIIIISQTNIDNRKNIPIFAVRTPNSILWSYQHIAPILGPFAIKG